MASSYAEFQPNFNVDAVYEVYGWWVASSNRCIDTPFIIKHKNGVDTVRVDQVQNGSQWKLIGTYLFSADTTQKITISNAGTTGSYVVADAIRLISYDPATPVEEIINQVPSQFVLNQNYPNPFNPSTTISWQLPESGWQTLKVYDILGNEVATLVDEYRTAGLNQVIFSENNHSSGIYFYNLRSGSFSETKSMLLIK